MTRRLKIPVPHRRGFLTAAAGLVGAASLGGCEPFSGSPAGGRTLALGEDANLYVQRLLLTPAALAREFPESAVSPVFRPNGTIDPQDTPYRKLAAKDFDTWRLEVSGLVEHPLSLSLSDLRAMPARTQVTRHDCVEGWSVIGKWTGVPLSEVLTKAGMKPQARYIVFRCGDAMEYGLGSGPADDSYGPEAKEQAASDRTASGQQAADQGTSDSAGAKADGAVAWGGGATDDGASGDAGDDTASGGRPIRYYESIDLTDAFHPQTILAYDLNGKTLPVSNGAPLRLRVERQLGYKQAKYIMRIQVVESLDRFGQGKGGYWEDNGYEWYAGI